MLSLIWWLIAIGVIVVVLPLLTALCFASTFIRFGGKNCLHCVLVKEVGRHLKYGEISRWGAMNDLVLVMADILATASIEEAKEMISAIIEHLSETEPQARKRHIHGSAFARTQGSGRRQNCPAR